MSGQLLISILNMSLVASYCILAVLVVRLALKRAPKVFSYCLWFLVLFRLLCPFSLGSVFSLLPTSTAAVPQDIVYQAVPEVHTGMSVVDQAINQTLPAATPYASANPIQIWLLVGQIGWLVGFSALLLYGIVSYLRFKYRLREATLLEGNIFECDRIGSPFVLGFFAPKIYLPQGLSQQEVVAILLHERTHIRRKDHWLKALAFFALCLHWFNPLVWLAFMLMTKDMELSCDESVLRQAKGDIRGSYSSSLLAVSCKNSGLFTPLAFGENCVKSRIQNVLGYQKPVFGIVALGVAALAIVAVALGTNPKAPALPSGGVSGSGVAPLGSAIPEDGEATIKEMADTWAHALQTREGRPRYDMMASAAREKFIAGQKERAGGGEDWYFNIGFSSPKVKSWEISLDPQTGRVDILYDAADSGGERYDWKEVVYFAQIAGEWKVVDYQDLGINGYNGTSYYADVADAAAVYIRALQNCDYGGIAESTWREVYTWEGQEIWNTVNISRISIVQTDIREEKACYELNLQVVDPGNSAFNEGENPRWLWLVKQELGWTVWGLMSSGAPDDAWWQAPIPESRGQEPSSITQIGSLLEEIIASPKASSNPGDYTAAHEEAFRQLVALGYQDLNAYYDAMDSAQRNGLAGRILEMAILLQSDLGEGADA